MSAKNNRRPSNKKRRPSGRRTINRRNRTSGSNSVAFNTRRNFNVYPKAPRFNGVPSTSWLDSLKRVGSVALGWFTKLIGLTDLGAEKHVVLSMAQCIYYSASDLLLDSPLVSDNNIYVPVSDLAIPSSWKADLQTFREFPFRQIQLRSATLTISPTSEMSKRAGQLAVAVMPITREAALKVTPQSTGLSVIDHVSTRWGKCACLVGKFDDSSERVATTCHPSSFIQIQQLPGAKTFSGSKTQSFRIPTSGFAAQWHVVGLHYPTLEKLGSKEEVLHPRVLGITAHEALEIVEGDMPLFKILIAYSNFASSATIPDAVYSADEATFNLSFHSQYNVRDPDRRILRGWPIVGIATDTATSTTGSTFHLNEVESVSDNIVTLKLNLDSMSLD